MLRYISPMSKSTNTAIRCTMRSISAAILSSTLLTAPTLAQDATVQPSIDIASMSIPFAYEENGDGVYNDIFDKLVEGYSGPTKVTFLPAARLDRAMKQRQTDCIYISADTDKNRGNEDSGYADYKFIGPINTISVVAYTMAGAKDITEPAQFNDLVVASDVNLVRFINSLGIEEDLKLQSQTQMIKMLAAGRVDALIGYDFDLDFLTKKMGVSNKLRKATIHLDEVDDGISCLRNEKTAAFVDHVTKRIKLLSDSGWFDEVFKDYR